MPKRIVTILLGGLAVIAGCGGEAAGLPPAVADALAALAADCTAVGGVPHAERAIERADLNADARADFVLFAGWIECEGAASVYGDREKLLTVFASSSDRAAPEAFSERVFDVTLEGNEPPKRLWLTVMGSQCGREPAADFASEFFCDRAIDWNAATHRFDYAPVETVRPIR